MKMLYIISMIAFCFPTMMGCHYDKVTFQYECAGNVMAVSKTKSVPLSINVQDARNIGDKDKNILSKYNRAYHYFEIISSKDMPIVIKEAICKELISQGYTLNEDSPAKLTIAINEICMSPLFIWSFDKYNNFGVINADISVVNKGKPINSINIQTSMKSSEDAKSGDPRDLASPLLYEFIQDVLSDREIVKSLTSINT